MRNRKGGFTLIELMVTLLIIGLTFGLAIPGFQGMMARNRITTETNNLVAALQLARSEASTRGGTVSIQAINGSTANDDFGSGFCVIADNPGNCTGAIRTFANIAAGTRIDSSENVTSIQFDSMGALANTGSATRALDICVDGYPGRRVLINLIGRGKIHRARTPANATTDPSC